MEPQRRPGIFPGRFLRCGAALPQGIARRALAAAAKGKRSGMAEIIGKFDGQSIVCSMQSRGRQSARGKRKHGGNRMKLRKDGTQAVGRLESDGLANRLRMAAGRMGQLQKDSLLPRLPGLPRLPARNIDRVTTGRTLGTERVGKTGPRTGAKTGAPSPARAQSGGENAGERERTSPFSRVPEWEKEAGKKATALFDEHGRYRGNASAGREKAAYQNGRRKRERKRRRCLTGRATIFRRRNGRRRGERASRRTPARWRSGRR